MPKPDRLIVYPVEGKVVSDRYNRMVPKEGARVVWDSYWDRRLAEGAITCIEYKPASEQKPSPKPEPEPKTRKVITKTTKPTEKK
jgi:hypothetical protein